MFVFVNWALYISKKLEFMKKILELAGVILACVLVPYLVASLLEWGFVVKEWHDVTKVLLAFVYFIIIPVSVFEYIEIKN